MKVLETLTGCGRRGFIWQGEKWLWPPHFLWEWIRAFMTFVFSKCLLNKELCERLGWVSMRCGW
jgi:hypothetical protein